MNTLNATQTMNLLTATAFVSGAKFAAFQSDDETVGYELFRNHLEDAKAMMIVAAEGSNPALTYDRVIDHFRMLQTSLSSGISQLAGFVVEMLEAGQ